MMKLTTFEGYDPAEPGKVYSVMSPKEMNRKRPSLVGHEILLDGVEVKVKKVYGYTDAEKIQFSEKIGLVVEPKE